MLKLLLPQTPLILKTALFHTLYLSPTSSKWDLKTELTVKILRQMLGGEGKPQSITKQQRLTTKDPGVKGKVWISKVKFEVPGEDDVRQWLFKAIEEMKHGGELYAKPEAKPLEAEWTGYRDGVSDTEPEPPNLSEAEKYEKLMKEVKSDVTLLYFHGGAMYLLDPATYRHVTSRLAKMTGGKVFSVRYRLSPQNPFPAALLDALTAYLSLLYPPAGAPHAPIPAKSIVVAGDSAGGLLSASLLQTILQFHRTAPSGKTPTVKFHGREVEIPIPGALALSSPWLDVTRSLPSLTENAKYDYLPPPSTHSAHTAYPACEVWPVSPPRADLYCEGSALTHPLVSPLAAKDWRNAPPILFALGEEMLADEDKVIAQRIARQGGKVVWLQYEAMPHCFSLMIEGLEVSRMYWVEFADFCKRIVEMPGKVRTEGCIVTAKSLVKRRVDVEKLSDLTDEIVDTRMRNGRERLERMVGGAKL
ncbi:alpha/beta-hydrolase [Zopfia rhizophila CBS 207.26]|uniref:Alpha/beta-hydrolase n=1 Tax=Zopfia rhizophila CBS 207.26 TaxID=1314779 RepID=A0A6A6EKC9_9PEZI|nr:alpha/beta-hydrolase [Zopfia rhizophila CBS 207.26]